MLETKNSDIKNLHSKLEEMTTSSSSMKTREHEFNKQAKQSKEAETKFKTEIVDLKRVISDRDQALSKARQKNTELTSQVKSVQQHEEREVQRLQAQIKDSTEVRSKIKSKSAEVSALNEMLTDSANKRDGLQKNVNELKSTLEEKDTGIQKLRKELDDVVASRNKVSTQLGELQSQGNVALEKLQQDLNNLANTRDEYKLRIDSLQSEVAELKDSKKQVKTLNAQNDEYKQQINSLQTELVELKDSKEQLNKQGEHSQAKHQAHAEKLKEESKIWQAEAKKLNTSNSEHKNHIAQLQGQVSELTQSKETELQDLRNQLSTSTQTSDARFKEATTEFIKKNSMLQNDLKTLQAKLHDQTRSIEQQKSDLAKQIEINQRTTAMLSEKESKLTEFRTRLNREESESQRLNRELSDTESLRLTLTERDAELRKTQIELQEASASGGPMQKLLDEQQRQNESLTKAIQDRDEELARLNTQMTNNRLRSKQQQSSITLLTQEKDAQSELVRSLEKQAENTLQLHTKIAQQSTELEDLRARLYERDNNVSTSVGLTGNAGGNVYHHTTDNSGLQQVETRQSAATKPRVFVRPDSDTEALTGATGYQSAQRAQFTLDGHRIRRPDGSDDLSLLPGVTQTIAGAFSRHGVTAFEQIVNWNDREVAHYAERVGVSVQRAQQYNWPKASASILNGTYRKDGQEIGN